MDGGITITGTRASTSPYMCKEQLLNFKYVQPVSDVWSIGATFYVMLTKQEPRQGPPHLNSRDLILQGKIIPIRHRNRNIPPSIAAIIDRALALDTNVRYETAGDMLAALEQVL